MKDIQKQCMRFSCCFASVKAMKRSGVGEDGEIRLAAALFNKKKVQLSNEDVDRRFKYLEAREFLRVLNKYAVAGDASRSRSVSLNVKTKATGCMEDERQEGRISASAAPGCAKRAMGRKRAKEVRVKEKQENKRICLASSALELQKKEVK